MRTTNENLPHIFQCMDMCILCVSKKSLIEQYQNTPYSLNITNNVSTVLLCLLCCQQSQVKFATLINSTFQVVSEAGHVDSA